MPKIEARIQVFDHDTGRVVWAEIVPEAFNQGSGLTDTQVWNRYLLPAFKVVQQALEQAPSLKVES